MEPKPFDKVKVLEYPEGYTRISVIHGSFKGLYFCTDMYGNDLRVKSSKLKNWDWTGWPINGEEM